MGAKLQKKQKEAKINLYFFLFLLNFLLNNRITFRDARQKPLTSYDPWRDVQPVRDDHSWWPFSHGSRACSRDGDCAAEMFFSLLFLLIYLLLSCILGCKITHLFRITQVFPKKL